MLRAEFEAISQGKTQKEIADFCGVSSGLISRVFRETTDPYPKIKQGIAAALGWTGDVEQLFQEVEITIKEG